MNDESNSESPSELIDARIDELGDWRGETLARIRDLITQADPDVVEEVKWPSPRSPNGVPVWSHDGQICTGETYKTTVKLAFAKGAQLDDPSGAVQREPRGATPGALHRPERGDRIDEAGSALIREAVALNQT